MEEREGEREIRSMAAAAFSLSAAANARAHLHFHFESHFLRSASPSLSILFLLSVFWFLPNKSLVRNSNQSKTTSESNEKKYPLLNEIPFRWKILGQVVEFLLMSISNSFAVDSTSIFP